jgi:hypothetical protein
MAIPTFDPYGETDYGDWQDPFVHKLLEGCPGCVMCVGWEGKTYDQIRAARISLVVGRRLRDRPEPTAQEIAREDRMWELRCNGE